MGGTSAQGGSHRLQVRAHDLVGVVDGGHVNAAKEVAETLGAGGHVTCCLGDEVVDADVGVTDAGVGHEVGDELCNTTKKCENGQ